MLQIRGRFSGVRGSQKRYEGFVQNVLSKFREAHEGLEFTYELPADDRLQYLELKLKFEQRHTCWCYHTRGEKQLLPCDSAQRKIIKRGIAPSCLMQAIKKSCFHAIAESLDNQAARLRKSGYPEFLFGSVAEKILSVVIKGKMAMREKPDRRPVAIAYIHGLSHRLKT